MAFVKYIFADSLFSGYSLTEEQHIALNKAEAEDDEDVDDSKNDTMTERGESGENNIKRRLRSFRKG
jgi:hypothetical protein